MKPGEPPITRRAAHDSGAGNLPPRRVVIHATCPPRVGYPAASKPGASSGTAKYFQMESSGGSAHYVYDSSRHEEHCVPERTIAWHAPPNSRSIGIEICGQSTYTREQWLSPAVWPAVEEAAKRTRDLCQRYRLPVRKLTVAQLRAGAAGVCGHVDVSAAFRQTDHTDPGPHFPWDRFMAAVLGQDDAEPGPAGPPPWPGRLLEYPPVMRGDDVRQWQQGAVKLGRRLVVDGAYGPDSRAVCVSIQRAAGIDDDGVVGPATWRATFGS